MGDVVKDERAGCCRGAGSELDIGIRGAAKFERRTIDNRSAGTGHGLAKHEAARQYLDQAGVGDPGQPGNHRGAIAVDHAGVAQCAQSREDVLPVQGPESRRFVGEGRGVGGDVAAEITGVVEYDRSGRRGRRIDGIRRTHDRPVVGDTDVAARPERRHAIAAGRNDGTGFDSDHDGAAETVRIRGTIVDGADAIRAGDRQDGCKIVDHDIAMDIGIDRIGIVRIVSGQDAGRRILHRSGGIGRDRPRIDGAGGQHLNDAGGWHGGERGSRNRPVERRNSRSPGFDRARAHVDVDIAGPKIARVNADAVAGRDRLDASSAVIVPANWLTVMFPIP